MVVYFQCRQLIILWTLLIGSNAQVPGSLVNRPGIVQATPYSGQGGIIQRPTYNLQPSLGAGTLLAQRPVQQPVLGAGTLARQPLLGTGTLGQRPIQQPLGAGTLLQRPVLGTGTLARQPLLGTGTLGQRPVQQPLGPGTLLQRPVQQSPLGTGTLIQRPIQQQPLLGTGNLGQRPNLLARPVLGTSDIVQQPSLLNSRPIAGQAQLLQRPTGQGTLLQRQPIGLVSNPQRLPLTGASPLGTPLGQRIVSNPLLGTTGQRIAPNPGLMPGGVSVARPLVASRLQSGPVMPPTGNNYLAVSPQLNRIPAAG